MSEYGAGRIVGQDLVGQELNLNGIFIANLSTTGKVQAGWPSVITIDSTAARNLDMPAPTAAGVANKLWVIFSVSTATITVRTDTGGTIIALTTTRRGALIGVLGGAWKLILKAAT